MKSRAPLIAEKNKPAEVAPFDDAADEKNFNDAVDLMREFVEGGIKNGEGWKEIIIQIGAICLAKSLQVAHIGGDRRRELESDFDGRIKAIENSAFEYSGVWKSDVNYRRNQFVSHGGAMWHAQIDSKGVVPGDGAMWKLAVKRGRDLQHDRF